MPWSTHSSPSLLLKLLQLALNESKPKSNSSSRHESFWSTLHIMSTQLLRKYWFLVGLAMVISLAVAFPDVARYGGYLHAEWTIKWGTCDSRSKYDIHELIDRVNRCGHSYLFHFWLVSTYTNLG